MVITGKGAIPTPGASQALKTFEGNKEDIAEISEDFENCTDNTQLPESERVKFLFRYLSRQQRDVFKTFYGYSMTTWTMFKATIAAAFEGAFKEKKHICQSLIQFTQCCCTQKYQWMLNYKPTTTNSRPLPITSSQTEVFQKRNVITIFGLDFMRSPVKL